MKRLLLIPLLFIPIFMSSCKNYNATDFVELHPIDNVKVLDLGEFVRGRESYDTLIYKDNVTGKPKELKFLREKDYGFINYYKSARMFDEEVYVTVIINKDNEILSLANSKNVGDENAKKK